MATRTTEADFDKLSWHDCSIWGMALQNGGGEPAFEPADLAFDIDFIVEWICGVGAPARFRVARAALVFHNVTDLRIEMCTTHSGHHRMALSPWPILRIERRPIERPEGYTGHGPGRGPCLLLHLLPERSTSAPAGSLRTCGPTPSSPSSRASRLRNGSAVLSKQEAFGAVRRSSGPFISRDGELEAALTTSVGLFREDPLTTVIRSLGQVTPRRRVRGAPSDRMMRARHAACVASCAPQLAGRLGAFSSVRGRRLPRRGCSTPPDRPCAGPRSWSGSYPGASEGNPSPIGRRATR